MPNIIRYLFYSALVSVSVIAGIGHLPLKDRPVVPEPHISNIQDITVYTNEPLTNGVVAFYHCAEDGGVGQFICYRDATFTTENHTGDRNTLCIEQSESVLCTDEGYVYYRFIPGEG